MGNIYQNNISKKVKNRIALVNYLNPYVDITPFELRIGIPIVNYQGFYVQQGELIIYAVPAQANTEGNTTVVFTSSSGGAGYKISERVTVHTEKTIGKKAKSNIKDFIVKVI